MLITEDMPTLESITYSDVYRMHRDGIVSAMDVLRFAMWREGGVWDSPRALRYLRELGWETKATYPLNLAGNYLARMALDGSAIRIAGGEYQGVPDVLESIMKFGKRAR